MSPDRFWSRFDKSGECWLWTGPTWNGYGKSGQGWTHRLAWEIENGPIPEGMTIDHLCRTRLCGRPSHLEPITLAENLRRGAAAITACPQGHPYDDANTYRTKSGHRKCRACHRVAQAARNQRTRGAAWQPARRLTDEQRLEARRMHAEGWSFVQLGRYFGFHGSTILRALQEEAAQ